MWLTKFFVVIVTLTGRICLSKNVIEINKEDGFAELEEAAIKLLTTCYVNHDKTIVLIGDFPGSFVKGLSSNQSFSLVLLDERRRTLNNIDYSWGFNIDTMHKVHIFVTIAPHYERVSAMVRTSARSAYHNPMAFLLVLGWSRENKYATCDRRFQTIDILACANINNMLNANLICRDYTKGIVIYTSNLFEKRAPEPWRFVRSMKIKTYPLFSYFMQEYREHEGMCKNLYFDKTQNLGGAPIEMERPCVIPYCSDEGEKTRTASRRMRIQEGQNTFFIDNFCAYINATKVTIWIERVVGKGILFGYDTFQFKPVHLRGVTGALTYLYPHGLDCKFLISQFRGNKSQLDKILSVIDKYSWYGMYTSYLVTLLFFKFFLHQPLLVAILNLVRLTGNLGLAKLPTALAPQIYLSCLLFFVVTMQGIFVGNLAALLTQDIPVRQIDSVKDVADLGYTVYAPGHDFLRFSHSISKSRFIALRPNEFCADYVIPNPLAACVGWTADDLDDVSKFNFYRSPGCLGTEYITHTVPWKWMLEEKLNTFLRIVIAGGIKMPLAAIVAEKRMLEAEAEDDLIPPRAMTVEDLAFSFTILGIGLGFASIAFIFEIIIDRLYRRIVTTRVIVHN